MRRISVIVAMVVALAIAHLVNVWFGGEWVRAVNAFASMELRWLLGSLMILTAAVGVALGWAVLRAPGPDALVGAVYAVVGLVAVFALPAWVWAGWALPAWLVDLNSGPLLLTVWLGAAIAAIGLAELLRWTTLRLGARETKRPGWHGSASSLLSR
jgi:hypothetical protein